jgi:hypothetical protein
MNIVQAWELHGWSAGCFFYIASTQASLERENFAYMALIDKHKKLKRFQTLGLLQPTGFHCCNK